MIADLIAEIQNNPDWIPYGLMVIVGLCAVVVSLLFWYRAAPLTWAQRQAVDLKQEVDALEGAATENRQQLSDMREELVRSAALKEQWQTDHDDLVDTRHALGQRQAEVASLKATIEHQRETDGTLKAQFTALANEVMKEQSVDFKKANQDQLTQVLQPLKEHIGRFETELRSVHEAAGKDRVALKLRLKR